MIMMSISISMSPKEYIQLILNTNRNMINHVVIRCLRKGRNRMTIYKGILGQMSGGYDHGNVVVREFVNIGNNHLKKFTAGSYLDEILLTMVDEEITISGIQDKNKFAVIAIKTPDGKVYKSNISTFSLIIDVLANAIVLPIIAGFFLLIVVFILWGISPVIGLISLVATIGIMMYLLIYPFRRFFKFIKAKNEL